MAQWHDRTPILVSLIGRPDFGPALDLALSQVAAFDLTCVFAYPGEERPLLLHDGLRGVSSPAIMANYLNGTYLLDAVYAACRRPVPDGLYRLRELAPDDFFEGDYFKSPAVHPCISMETGTLAEEIVFIAALSPSTRLAYSLMRQNGRETFTETEMEALRTAAPMVTALLAQHWRSHVPADGAVDGALLERAFSSFRPGTLTAREQTIVSLVLRGHSSLSIARLLDIAEGTVKNHRKHIHAKLGISSQTELFNLFIGHLIGEA
ncbi:LuxR C-terminal-related transcriptional regulator [Zavarzinia compransoris]|uniref:helix-turn-helix transcriptional regulator n=1 Tax=Zavarzinia marina TaxID=2911065 RepID=UPI001F2E1FFC|nr:LuxR C-terminal-related transcriptional regulator [Zavarzinia marina]MCF4167155.1 LuxR C-terminal-related transcriptional regulator [Zavarzinia marina]